MKALKSWRISVLGTGNVAWQLAHALMDAGFQIHQVLNRTPASAEALAMEINASSFGLPSDLDPVSDICLVCVSDDSMAAVLDGMNTGKCLMLHTSGSVSMDVFSGKADRFGVLYPLQTFTKGRHVDLSEVPFLIEAGLPGDLEQVRTLASALSQQVVVATSVERSILHLAAVFASNFSNHMFALAERLALEKHVDFKLLVPLMRETTAKASEMSPAKAQTGPAVRQNEKVMKKHMEMLKDNPRLQEMYRVISESIREIK